MSQLTIILKIQTDAHHGTIAEAADNIAAALRIWVEMNGLEVERLIVSMRGLILVGDGERVAEKMEQ